MGGGQAGQLVGACRMSFGMSTRTGPGRPVDATWNASAIAAGIRSASVTSSLCLVTGSVIPVMSASWNASLPIIGPGRGLGRQPGWPARLEGGDRVGMPQRERDVVEPLQQPPAGEVGQRERLV